MVSIRLDNISKSFGQTTVLKDVSLEIRDGEFFCVLGPSGGGKTTLLRIIAGLEKPDAGRVYFDDADVTSLMAKERNVSMIFQSLALYPHLTVYENIAFPLRVRKLSEQYVKQAVKDVASMMRIMALLNRNITSLSGGERQRVAIARALVYKPKVFLMDEPLTGLEPSFRQELRTEIKELQRSTGITTVYVTHDQVEAFALADRVALLHEGLIQDVGDPLRVYEKPANLWVCRFVGDAPVNVFEGVLEELGERTLIKIDELGLTLNIQPRRKTPEKKVYVAIRPESFKIADNASGLTAKVVGKEVLGDRVVYMVDVNGCKITVKTVAAQAFQTREKLSITPDESKILLFDKEGRPL
ncbi:MAG: ABC transporter ATP-binding protein [Candidatus Caldarchaeum sp.]